MKKFSLIAGCSLALASTSLGQSLNEIYASHSSTDNEEFIEVVGTPNASLDGFMLLIIEGDSGGQGVLDQAIDLTGQVLSATGYFVAGTTGGSLVPDLAIGTDNVIENGTDTFYLISTTDVAGVSALVTTDLDTDDDFVTDLAGLGTVTIVDVVAMTDGDVGDETYDGATVIGPDGTNLPAGIFTDSDTPGAWCDTLFLDFDVTATDRTPGAANGVCPAGVIGTPYCFGDGSGTACPCGNTGGTGEGCANSTTAGSTLTASGSLSITAGDLVLTGAGVGANVTGIFFSGTTQITGGNGNQFGDGLRCVGGPVVRFETVMADAGGVATTTVDIPARIGATVGSTNTIQHWYRDTTGPCGNLFNFSHGLSVTWAN